MTRTKPPGANGNRNQEDQRTRGLATDQFPHRLPDRWWIARYSNGGHGDGELGRPPVFKTPEELWDACCQYFEWAETHPIYESRAFQHKDDVQLKNIPKLRPFSQGALCRFLNISVQAWWNYRNSRGPEFNRVCLMVDEIIFEQKFNGAAAGLFNPTIICRDLGLRDGMEVTGPGGGPVQTMNLKANLKNLTDDELILARKLLPDDIFQDEISSGDG